MRNSPSAPHGRGVLVLTRLGLALVLLLAFSLCSGSAFAAPEAHILRIDPRAAQENGNPILTTVIEVVQSNRVSDAIAPCGLCVCPGSGTSGGSGALPTRFSGEHDASAPAVVIANASRIPLIDIGAPAQ